MELAHLHWDFDDLPDGLPRVRSAERGYAPRDCSRPEAAVE